MSPFHFGRSHEPMYGVLHEPTIRRSRQNAVILCNPIGHEYMRSHQALKKLADALAANGHFVLRFDYRFTGDSAGDFSTLRLAEVDQDIRDATEEIRSLSGCRKIDAIGLRLGALFLLRTIQHCQFNNLTFWDPVLDGAKYITGLRRMQSDLLASSYYYSRPRSSDDTEPNELLGYVYHDQLIKEITTSNFESLDCRQTSFDCIVSEGSRDSADLPAKYVADNRVEYIPDMGGWSSIYGLEQLLITPKIERRITDLVASHA